MITSLKPYENIRNHIFIKKGEVIIYTRSLFGIIATYWIGSMLILKGLSSDIRIFIILGIMLCLLTYRTHRQHKEGEDVHEKDGLLIFSQLQQHVRTQRGYQETILEKLNIDSFLIEKNESNILRPFSIAYKMQNKNHTTQIDRYAKKHDAEKILKKIKEALE